MIVKLSNSLTITIMVNTLYNIISIKNQDLTKSTKTDLKNRLFFNDI